LDILDRLSTQTLDRAADLSTHTSNCDDPDFFAYLHSFGSDLINSKRLDESEFLFRHLPELKTAAHKGARKNALTRIYLGRCLLRQGHIPETTSIVNSLLQEDLKLRALHERFVLEQELSTALGFRQARARAKLADEASLALLISPEDESSIRVHRHLFYNQDKNTPDRSHSHQGKDQ
jgi:hypothetical protein